MNIDFKIRKDFQSIEEEIFKLNEYGKNFHEIRSKYSDLKNREDFGRIYDLSIKKRQCFEHLYSSGGDSSFNISDILLNINYIHYFPTLTKVINELEKIQLWEKELNKSLLESEREYSNLDLSFYSIPQMHLLHQQQLEYLSYINMIIASLKESDLYKKENNILISNILSHKHNQPEKFYEKWWIISLVVGLLGGILTWWNSSYQFGITIALILFFIMIIFNPKRRFLRIGLGLLTLGSMSLSPSFIDWISKILNLNIHINPWIGALLIIGSFFLFFLDHKMDEK